jgi:folate-binding protein YgfZ
MTLNTRTLIHIGGDDCIGFLQGIVTQDVTRLAADKIQFAALLSPQGKILHDMFLIDAGEAILLDTQAAYKDALLKRLRMYKLRAKVRIEEISAEAASTRIPTSLADPRHPDLPLRDYASPEPRVTNHESLSLGIPELGRDFEPDSIVAMDAGYDLLHAISFTKGCYVGQEIIARMHYKTIARRGFFILEHDTMPPRLALLKFDDVYGDNPSPAACHPSPVTLDGITYRATLPAWMQPKLVQFENNRENQ